MNHAFVNKAYNKLTWTQSIVHKIHNCEPFVINRVNFSRYTVTHCHKIAQKLASVLR